MSLTTLGQQNPRDSLIIFNRFRVDHTLLKHAKPEEPDEQEEKEGWGDRMKNGPEEMMNFQSSLTISNVTSKGLPTSQPTGWWARLKRWLARSPEPESVLEVFARIKASTSELEEWGKRNASLMKMIHQAELAGQKELVKKLEAAKCVRKFENMLYVKGRRKLLTEQQLLDFTSQCERGLCLDWVKDFVRPIPPDVVVEKIQCDEDHLFDNYAVLHFDPENRATTSEAREKARDPILFGLIKGSRKLYFIGDWMDEQCDLTFSQIIDKPDQPLEIPD